MKRALTTLSLLLCITMANAQGIIKKPAPGKAQAQKTTQTQSTPQTKGNTAQTEGPKQERGKVYDIVEQQPLFPGGPAALMKFINENTKYPEAARNNGVQGRVMVQFVVEKDGSLSDIQVLRCVDPSLDQEAVRVVKSMPRWIPGNQNGALVRVRYRVPVLFRL